LLNAVSTASDPGTSVAVRFLTGAGDCVGAAFGVGVAFGLGAALVFVLAVRGRTLGDEFVF